MIPDNNGFWDGLRQLDGKDLKKGGGISFLSKKQRLEMQLLRLDEKQETLNQAKQKKQADLMLLDGEDSDEDFFKYKINANDWEVLQLAKMHGVVNP